MFSIDSKDFRVSAAARITVRDYSDYGSDLCHDAEVMEEVDSYKGQADTSIMYQPA